MEPRGAGQDVEKVRAGRAGTHAGRLGVAARGFNGLCVLPQEDAWDFPLRHPLAVAEDGKRIAFGTTSCNLYVSEDGGRTWQAVTGSPPLVYAVRFA